MVTIRISQDTLVTKRPNYLKFWPVFFLFLTKVAVADCTELVQKTPREIFPDPKYRPEKRSDTIPMRAIVDKPGAYCLRKNLHVDGQYQALTPEGPYLWSDDYKLILLKTGDVTIDFLKHTASSDAAIYEGVSLDLPVEIRSELKFPAAREQIPKNITLKNGRIKLERHGYPISFHGPIESGFIDDLGKPVKLIDAKDSRSRRRLPETDAEIEQAVKELNERLSKAAGEPVKLVDAKDFIGLPSPEPRLEEANRAIKKRNETLSRYKDVAPEKPSEYDKRNYVIENMRIKSRWEGVILQGASSIIRNSVIETDSGAAIVIFGPNALIENNTIVVRCIEERTYKQESGSHCKNEDAPIRLMHGDGAIIRNNRFILEGHAKQRAVSVFDTGEFTFENNTVIGLKDANDIAKVFSGELKVKAKNNKLGN